MNRLFARSALLPEGWRTNVLLEWDESGTLTQVDTDVSDIPAGVVTEEVVLPGMPNLHSHAFQRAMAGLTEYRSDPTDSFWSWRTLMYAFAQRLTPDALYAVALQLYIEMLKAGYTSVCEFHYVHHDVGGKPYANRAEMSEVLVQAAQEAGIGMTLLPVMYQYSGFGERAPHAGQARFINSPEWMLTLLDQLKTSLPQHAGLRYGVAPHSLRAVSPQALRSLTEELTRSDASAPIHIHIAEQIQEVDGSIAHFGARPVEWLFANVDVNQHWCLVHATHMTGQETLALAKSQAVAGICPTTEANLGDGVFNGPQFAAANGRWGVGSDSNVATCAAEELRIFEYSQRLAHRQRNVLVDQHTRSVGSYLFQSAIVGGAAATGRTVAGLAVGQCADLQVLDANHPSLVERRAESLMDSFVFCQHGASPVCHVMSRGQWCVRDGKHALEPQAASGYRAAMQALLAD